MCPFFNKHMLFWGLLNSAGWNRPVSVSPSHPAEESLSLVYFWLRVRGSTDHFPSSAHWCCFKLGVYQRLIWKNGRIWGRPSITGAEGLVFSLGPITFDESLLKTPLGKAWTAFAWAKRHFLSLSDCFWRDRWFFNVPQPSMHVVNYFGLFFVYSGWTTIHFQATILNPDACTSSDCLGVSVGHGSASALVYFQ